MAIWEISFRVQYDYPFIKMSGQHPGIPVSMWCLWNRELLQVPTRDPETLAQFERDIARTGHIIEKWADSEDARVFLLKCTCNRLDSPWNIVEGIECLEVPPVVYQDGWANLRAISFDDSRTKELFRKFNDRGPTELIRKRELPLTVLPSSVWVNSLFGEMTMKQMDALLKAHRYGYYTLPRDVKTDSIAKSLGVSRSTYEEHLRKAENKIVGAIVPYLQIFMTADRSPEKEPERTTIVAPKTPVQA